MNLIDIGGGFPAPYDASGEAVPRAPKVINAEIERLFPPDIQILAEPGRLLVATRLYRGPKIVGKPVRDGKAGDHINDGVYHTYSGVIFDHCKYPIRAFKKGADPDQLRSSVRPATRSTWSRWRRTCPSWSAAISFTA